MMTINKFLKVCSVLPAVAIMPVMAETFTTEQQPKENKVWNVANSDIAVTPGQNPSVLYVTGTDITVMSGSKFENNKAGSGTVYVGTSGKVTVESGTEFIDNEMAFDGGALANFGTLVANGVLVQGNVAQAQSEDDDIPVGGGALALGSSSNTVLSNSQLIGNQSYVDGGAIGMRAFAHGNHSAAKLDITNVSFKNNNAVANGGAINNFFYDSNTADGMVYVANSEFTGNYATNGGAIYNHGLVSTQHTAPTVPAQSGAMKLTGVDFVGNYSTIDGGAIYNEGTLVLNDVDFDANTAKVYADDTWGGGGAIFNRGSVDITDTEFENNLAYVGGAYSDARKSGAKAEFYDVEFENNHAVWDGGAMVIYDTAIIDTATFKNNTAAIDVPGIKDGELLLDGDASYSDGGGAILAGDTSSVSIKNTSFVGNKSAVRGGAISARHVDGYSMSLDNVSFRGNVAGKFGGAISTVYAGVINLNDVSFLNNSAGLAGGAIYVGRDKNYGSGGTDGVDSTNHGVLNITSTNGKTNSFTGNVADDKGGAIFADTGATINITGLNVFEKNSHLAKSVTNGDTTKVQHSANDIYNDGALNINGGTTTIASGIDGAGTLTVASGAVLNIGTTTIAQNDLVLNGTINLDVLKNGRNGTAIHRATTPVTAASETLIFGKLNIANAITGNGTLNLNISSVGEYQIFGGGAVIDTTATDSVNITYGGTYDVSYSTDGKTVIVKTKDVAQIAADTNISENSAQIVSLLANSNGADLMALSLRVQQELNAGNSELVSTELSKANPDNKPIVQSVAAGAQNQVLSIASTRMSGAAHVGRNGGDFANTEYGMWAHGLFNKSKMDDQFHGYTRGVAVGFDANIDKKYTLGIGAAFNNTDVHAVNARDTDIDSTSLFAYAQYKPNNWFVNGALTYTMSEYDEHATMFGYPLRNKYDVDSYGASIMTGYDFASGFTPEMGARYLSINGTEYTDTLGTRVTGDDTHYLTGVAGVRYAFALDTDSQWNWRPEFHAAATYDFVSDKAYATVLNPGAAAYVVGGDRLNRMGGEFGLGLNMTYNGLDILLKYDLNLRQDYTSQTGMVKFRIDF